MPQVPQSARNRHHWIDLLRGTSVLMVIILHAHQYAFFGYVDDPASVRGSLLTDLIATLNASFAPLRMQLMFLLSGLFVARSLDKGSAPYLSGKLRGVLYPFVLWSLVIFLVRDGGATLLKGAPVAWDQLLMIATGSSTLTWFLYDLFIFYLVTPYLRRFHPLLVVLGALALALWVPDSVYLHPPLFYYFIYFFLGDYATRARFDLSERPPAALLLLSVLSLAAVIAVSNSTTLAKQWPGYLPLVLGALPALIQAAVWAGRQRWSAPLLYIGRNSIVFYLVHYPPYLVLAYLLHRVSHDGTLMFGVLLCSGLAGPLTLCVIRDRLRGRWVDRLFSLPPRRSKGRLAPQGI
jgi:uncharacterized membrane protein YcfT